VFRSHRLSVSSDASITVRIGECFGDEAFAVFFCAPKFLDSDRAILATLHARHRQRPAFTSF
jgi:hypothetical protein